MCWQRQDRLHWSAQTERWDRSPRDRRADAGAEGRSDLRIADADRTAVIDDLRRHTGEGRLTLEEFEQRVDEALRARTRADLDHAMRELPPSSVATPHSSGPGRPICPGVVVAACLLVVGLLALGLWWVLIPVGFCVFGGCGRRAAPPATTELVDDRDDSVTYA